MKIFKKLLQKAKRCDIIACVNKKGTIQGYSSAGRVPVSKTVGRGFESSCPCHNRSRTASVFLLSSVLACFYVWNAFFDEFSGGFFMDTRVSSFCFVQSVTIIPFGIASKKHQSFKKALGLPNISRHLRSPFYLLTATQFLMRYKQKSLVIPLSIVCFSYTV